MMKMAVLKAGFAAACVCAAVSAYAESLYRPGTFHALTSDRKAAEVGDLLTVQVFESATATTSADTATRRSNSVGAAITHSHGDVLHAGIQTNGDFDGGGKTERTNRFLTSLTVTVRELLPNGDLRVEGQQELSLGDERQTINVQGRVRRADISDGNVVLSTRLADAKITLVGAGDLSERQKRAWWRRGLDWLGL
jgi:flagellar L-ring protein precursor FlgH